MKQNKQPKPKVVKGNHLTVTTWPDGKTTLEWDDEALLQEIRTAIAVHEAKQKSKHLQKYGIKTKGKY
jgi:YD repeat-containing protein